MVIILVNQRLGLPQIALLLLSALWLLVIVVMLTGVSVMVIHRCLYCTLLMQLLLMPMSRW